MRETFIHKSVRNQLYCTSYSCVDIFNLEFVFRDFVSEVSWEPRTISKRRISYHDVVSPSRWAQAGVAMGAALAKDSPITKAEVITDVETLTCFFLLFITSIALHQYRNHQVKIMSNVFAHHSVTSISLNQYRTWLYITLSCFGCAESISNMLVHHAISLRSHWINIEHVRISLSLASITLNQYRTCSYITLSRFSRVNSISNMFVYHPLRVLLRSCWINIEHVRTVT